MPKRRLEAEGLRSGGEDSIRDRATAQNRAVYASVESILPETVACARVFP